VSGREEMTGGRRIPTWVEDAIEIQCDPCVPIAYGIVHPRSWDRVRREMLDRGGIEHRPGIVQLGGIAMVKSEYIPTREE